ncbi:MAG TPA: hypothetical protein VE291_14055 [Terracidiphilus sp.]|jgi:hypothetical protein|nr:hypothetical protein [Terracidiphilus sp.]
MAGARGSLNLQETIAFVGQFKSIHPDANKADIEETLLRNIGGTKERSVIVGNGFALRLCEANTPSFSNVVLSLSALQKYDALPMVVCIIRPSRADFRLANSTFLRRISHSSHTLREDNIRGSFLGHDIMDEFEDVPNLPEHFEKLFAVHSEFTWAENVVRLVEATNAIVGRSTRFDITTEVLARLMEAPGKAALALQTAKFHEVEQELSERIEAHRDELLRAAALDNVNVRGNTIEQTITGEVNAHRLDDLVFPLAGNVHLVVDIKTKLLDRASAPKAYNIDKMLHLLAQGDKVFAFFFIGLNAAHHSISTQLVSIFDPVIVRATRIQTHWAGRQSRGVTQLTGDISRIFAGDYRPSVDVDEGQELLRLFVER